MKRRATIVVSLSYGFIPGRQALPQMSVAGLKKAAEFLRGDENSVIVLTSAGFKYCQPEFKARVAELKKVGVGEVKILKARPSISTIDEAEAVKEVVVNNQFDVGRLILIADKDHMGRARFIFEKVLPGIPIWEVDTSAPLDSDNPLLPLKYRPIWKIANILVFLLLRIFGIKSLRNLAHPHPGEK